MAIYLANSALVVVGGQTKIGGNRWNRVSNSEVVDIDGENTKCSVPDFPRSIDGGSSAILQDTLVSCGGWDVRGRLKSSCFAYNGKSSRWRKITSMKIKRGYFTLTTIKRGILAIGGPKKSCKNGNCTAFGILVHPESRTSLELLTDISSSWSKLEDLPAEIESHCTVALKDQTVFVMGGYQDGKVC